MDVGNIETHGFGNSVTIQLTNDPVWEATTFRPFPVTDLPRISTSKRVRCSTT